MNLEISNKLLMNAIVSGIVWYITYLYIRRYLNPENNKNISKWSNDAIYGALASFASVIAKDIITKNL
jgi:uncharacterized membrane-anchored protein